jgi:4'-phosphopantetheinyl transferase
MSQAIQPWADAPERPVIEPAEVHVWLARLDQPEAELRALSSLLSEDELERAGRFRFPRDREHFVAARGALREILSRYTGTRPRLLGFDYDRYGKPSLRGEAGAFGLHFNVSHSGGVALYALARGRAVGVDVELVREEFAGFDIAERFFAEREVAALRALQPGERARAFFDCWTRKEAFVKARGEGLSHPLDRFAVSLAPGEAAALVWTGEDPREAERWSLSALPVGDSYRAALAVEGEATPLRLWRWPGPAL